MTDTNQKVASLTQRVAYVKGELEAVPKNATNHHGKYKYASRLTMCTTPCGRCMSDEEIDIKIDLVDKQVAESSERHAVAAPDREDLAGVRPGRRRNRRPDTWPFR